MACAQQSAVEYLRKSRSGLVTQMQNLPLIIENLYQQKVFNVHDVDALKAEETEFNRARFILDRVINKGEEACYELLRILDFTRKRTLPVDLHFWISCFSFREDADASYSFGTKPCQNYKMQLKYKAKSILKKQWKQSCKYLHNNAQTNFNYIPLVLETGSVVKTANCKIKIKCKKFRKLRPKKLRSYIPDKHETFSPEYLLKWKTRNILLIGKPGIGKTTVVQQMLKMWTEREDIEPDYMFYFDETVVSHLSNLLSLESFLFDVYLKPTERDRQEVFQDIEENSENVLIVFDGVNRVQENSILQKIMDQDLLPEAKVIITCRTEVEDDFFSDWPSQKVYVQGFSEESIRTYHKMMLGHNPDLLDVVLTNQELFSLSHVPMYAFMIIAFVLFNNDTVSNQSNTVTEMYIHIFRDTCGRKCGRKTLGQIDQYLREVKDQLDLLMKNAFSATEQKSLNLPEISGDETNICHAFLKMLTIRDSLTSETKYFAFLHNTMQEFFSALWLVENQDEIVKVLKLCQTEENQHMRHVVPFLCGLLGEHNNKLLKCLFSEDQMKKTSEWFTEKLLDTFLRPQSDGGDIDLLYVCQCLYELQSSNACLMFLEKMKYQLDIDVNPDPHQSCALSYVISQSTDKEVHLNLENCTVSDTGLIMILSCSPKIRIKLWDEPLQQIKFLLEILHEVSKKHETLTSCCWTSDKPDLSQALLDLCSHVKDYETQTGRSLLPALQSVYQTAPDVWIIDLSKRKTSILLEVLKLQTEKKPVELRGWTDEESQVMSFLQCLPYISQLRFEYQIRSNTVRCVSQLFIKAAETETQTGDQMLKLLTSVCTYTSFPYEYIDRPEQRYFLLDLYSHMKDYEAQTGRSLLPALQSVYQTPDVWSIDLSKRKTSILLEVLKLQTEKKPVELRGWTDDESQVMSFLQCLPYISQLRFDYQNLNDGVQCVSKLFIKAADTETQTGDQMLKLLSSVCTYTSFPYEYIDTPEQSDFLLDLYSHVKHYDTQTGRSLLPALQSVYQTAPAVWFIDLSERKTSILLEVLKLQTEKKPVLLRGWTDEESQVMRFLQCLPYISQLGFALWNRSNTVQCVSQLFIKAAETETQTGDQMLKLLTSVCTYTSFPYGDKNSSRQSDFLLDLYSHLKDYETQTGRSLLPALQSVYQTAPDVWIIDLSKRKTSILLEVLKLQTEKKPVELRGCPDDESQVMSFFQCLPYISQLRFDYQYLNDGVQCVSKLFIKAAETETQTGDQMLKLLTSVCTYTSFPYEYIDRPEQSDFLLDLYSHVKDYETQTGRSLLPALQSVYQTPDVWIIDLLERKTSILLEVLKLQTEKKPVELIDWTDEESQVMSYLQCLPYISQLRLSGYMVVRIVRAVRSARVPVTLDELSADLNDKRRSDSEMSRVLSSLASLLRLWTVQCLNLSDCRMKSLSLILLLSKKSPVTLRLSKETLQSLTECVYEAQEEELTSRFLQKVGRDLTPCALSWETLHYFLQRDTSHVTVDLKETDISFNFREILPFLKRIHFQRMSSTLMLCLLREIYESRSLGFVSGLLSSVKNCINLQNRALDLVHCEALRFILQHCTAVTLNMLWTSIPEEELKSILPLLSRVSCLSVDRVLLLRMLRCCSSSDVQQEASADLLSALQHKLDFSCGSALDLTEDTPTQTLQLTAEDCRVMSTVVQRVYRDTHTLTQLNLHDCQMNTAGIDQVFTILRSVKLQCGKSMLLQFLSHVDDGKAECLSRSLGEEVDLSQTHLDLQVCRGLALVLEHSEGLTELDLSQCHLTDQSLNLLLPNLHKAQNIDFTGNSITDTGALEIYSIVSHDSNIKTVRLFNNRIESRKLLLTDPRFEIW